MTVSNWRDPHVLTRYINFNLFRPTYARPLKPQTAGDIVIDSAAGPLAFATERQGVRYLALGISIRCHTWGAKTCPCRYLP